MSTSKIVGIDLGTTYSTIAHLNDYGKPEIIPNEENERLTPSVILFDDNEIIVGTIARESAVAEPDNVVEYIKREMGRTDYFFKHKDKEYSPERLSGFILQKLKQDAENYLGITIKNAIITVPAYFNDNQRLATIEAGYFADLEVKRVINEPTAAAISYGVHQLGQAQTILVFDLGGGTFDVTILKIKGNHIQMLATNGDHHLGGKDWDDALIMFVAEQFQQKYGHDPLDDMQTYFDLQNRAVQAKIMLSQKLETKLVLNCAGGTLGIKISRELFEELTQILVGRCESLLQIVLDEAKLKAADIDTILLAGGSTRMPMIRTMLKNIFNKEPDTSINPDECVALGAALQGAILEYETGRISLAKSKRLRAITTSDVASHSLGVVSIKGGKLNNSIIIPKNTTIPCEKSRQDYITSRADQDSLDVYLVQGEDDDPTNCTVLGCYEFSGIPPRPAGKSTIKISFKYTINSTVEISAIDLNSEKMLPQTVKKDFVDLEHLLEGGGPMDIALIIDCSGSMSGDKLSNAKDAIYQFLENIGPTKSRVSLTSFGDPRAEIKVALTSDYSKISKAARALHADNGTPMSFALSLTESMMSGQSKNSSILILLTDGMPNSVSDTRQIANYIKSQNMRIIAIGVGNDVRSDFLREIASSPDDYHCVGESIELSSTFINIATELSTPGYISKSF